MPARKESIHTAFFFRVLSCSGNIPLNRPWSRPIPLELAGRGDEDGLFVEFSSLRTYIKQEAGFSMSADDGYFRVVTPLSTSYTDVLSKSETGEAFLQSRLFQSLSKKFVIIAGSGIFSSRKADSGNCKVLGEGLRRNFFQESCPHKYFFDYALVLRRVAPIKRLIWIYYAESFPHTALSLVLNPGVSQWVRSGSTSSATYRLRANYS